MKTENKKTKKTPQKSKQNKNTKLTQNLDSAEITLKMNVNVN